MGSRVLLSSITFGAGLLLSSFCLNAYEGMTPNVPHGTPVWATPEDIHVAYVIMGEAESEGDYGQKLVADCIFTQMKARGKTHYLTVTVPNLFKGYRDQNTPTRYVWSLVRMLKFELDPIPEISFPYFRTKGHRLPEYAKEPMLTYKNHVYFNE